MEGRSERVSKKIVIIGSYGYVVHSVPRLNQALVEAQLPDFNDDDDPEGLRLFRKTSRGFVPIVTEEEEKSKPKQKAKEENSVQVGEGQLRLPASAFASHKEEKASLVNQG